MVGRLLRTLRIDVLHSHNYKSNFYALFSTWLHKPRPALIATNHLWAGKSFRERVYQLLDALWLRMFDQVAAVSDKIRDDMAVFGIPNILVIYNGIDVDDPDFGCTHSADRENASVTIGNIGRMTLQKAQDDLITAFSKCATEFPNLRLKIVGDGPERIQLKKLIDRLQLGRSVSLLEPMDRIRQLYRSFDMFVLPSRDEGLPMVLLEAMAAGVPVIASSVGAIPSVINHGKNGILVESGNQHELVAAIACMTRDQNLRERLGTVGRETVRTRYSSLAMAREYRDLYEKTTDTVFGKAANI